MAGALTLADFRAELIRVVCHRCDRRGQYRRTTLIALYSEKRRSPTCWASSHTIARSVVQSATRPVAPTSRTWLSARLGDRHRAPYGGDMNADEPTIASLPEAIDSAVNKLVENDGARFPFLVAGVGLNGSMWYSRVELLEAGRSA